MFAILSAGFCSPVGREGRGEDNFAHLLAFYVWRFFPRAPGRLPEFLLTTPGFSLPPPTPRRHRHEGQRDHAPPPLPHRLPQRPPQLGCKFLLRR